LRADPGRCADAVRVDSEMKEAEMSSVLMPAATGMVGLVARGEVVWYADR